MSYYLLPIAAVALLIFVLELRLRAEEVGGGEQPDSLPKSLVAILLWAAIVGPFFSPYVS